MQAAIETNVADVDVTDFTVDELAELAEADSRKTVLEKINTERDAREIQSVTYQVTGEDGDGQPFHTVELAVGEKLITVDDGGYTTSDPNEILALDGHQFVTRQGEGE